MKTEEVIKKRLFQVDEAFVRCMDVWWIQLQRQATSAAVGGQLWSFS